MACLLQDFRILRLSLRARIGEPSTEMIVPVLPGVCVGRWGCLPIPLVHACVRDLPPGLIFKRWSFGAPGDVLAGTYLSFTSTPMPSMLPNGAVAQMSETK